MNEKRPRKSSRSNRTSADERPTPLSGKCPFEINAVMDAVREAVRSFPMAALFELQDEGFSSPFEQLVACIISIRTRDETMLQLARSLFKVARTPAEMGRLSPDEIAKQIRTSSFAESKARQIATIAHQLNEEHGGDLPCNREVLLSFSGVGPKCANLVLGIACNQPWIGVDIHVHRVTNRWGYVAASTPEKTMVQLEKKLPRKYWVEINRLLVPFGKNICTGTVPKCSTCPVRDMCRQVGVSTHR